MRDDMHKVLVERPRTFRGCRSSHGRYPRRERAGQAAFEELPLREALGRGYGTKALNENLAPLRRFLERRVGRRWDRVFAELSARIDGGSAIQRHILQHLDDFVARQVVEVGGVLHHAPRWGGLEPLHAARRFGRAILYVCPRTGLLRPSPPAPSRRTQPARALPSFVRVGPTSYWLRREGVWFAVELAALVRWPWDPRAPERPPAPVDALSHAATDSRAHAAYARLHALPWARTHYVVELHQIGKKALRARFQRR